MATNTNGIATISDVLKIQGVTISGTYDANQCVKYSDITKTPIHEIIPKTKITFDFEVENQTIMKDLTLYIKSLGTGNVLTDFAWMEDYYGEQDAGEYQRDAYLTSADEFLIYLNTQPRYDTHTEGTRIRISIDGNILFDESWENEEISINFTLPANDTTLNYEIYNNYEILFSYFKDIKIHMSTY